MRIAIPISSYMWAGGAELIGNFTTAIKHEYPESEIFLLHNSSNKFTSKIIRIIYSILLIFKLGPLAVFKDVNSIIMGTDNIFSLNDFIRQDEIFQKVDVVETDFSSESLNSIRDKYRLDVIFGASYPLPKEYSGKWIGYITDIQHRRFKNNFTWMERLRRDYIFSQILKHSGVACVNSFDVKNDLVNYYGAEYSDKIRVLPVCPFPRKQWLIDESDMLAKYKLPKKYFLISSQLWVHKSHITAFRALKQISKKHNDVYILCTGDTNDYRNPAYFGYLKDQVKSMGLTDKILFLGLIPKNDQIQIMRKSIAVLQPSIFEGGPGGGAVQNAIALGVRSIVADIPINREIKDPTVTYFTAESYSDLAKKMNDLIGSAYVASKASVIKKGSDMKTILARNIMKTIKEL